jgi:hypothetical protein
MWLIYHHDGKTPERVCWTVVEKTSTVLLSGDVSLGGKTLYKPRATPHWHSPEHPRSLNHCSFRYQQILCINIQQVMFCS